MAPLTKGPMMRNILDSRSGMESLIDQQRAQLRDHMTETKMEEMQTLRDLEANPEVERTAGGGYHSKLEYRMDLLPPEALKRAAHILWEGIKKYPKDNWRKIPPDDHLNHALAHLVAYMAGDPGEDHLGHALCRVMFLVATHQAESKDSG